MASEGKVFEQSFKESVPSNTFFMRLKDVFSGFNNENRTFTPPNICDAVMYSLPTLYLLEFKSTKGTSFSFSEKIIKPNQIKELSKASTYTGVIPGFIFNFRDKYNLTYFVHINEFNKFKETCGKQSMNQKDMEKIGILIEQTLKKVKYKYNIEKFIKDVQESIQGSNE